MSFKTLMGRFWCAHSTKGGGPSSRSVRLQHLRHRRTLTRLRECTEANKPSTYETYLLSARSRKESGYPLPSYDWAALGLPPKTQAEPGWIETPPFKANTKEGEAWTLYGVDCEMVTTENGLELARVSVVDAKGKLIFDRYVRPDKEILDYATQYSGVTAQHLENITTRLADIQDWFRQRLDQRTVLIGHSLDCTCPFFLPFLFERRLMTTVWSVQATSKLSRHARTLWSLLEALSTK